MMAKETLIDYLEQLELSPLEIKIYLLLSKLGTTSAKTLIKELHVNRTSIYPPLDSLFDRGLITKISDGSSTQFSVTDPENSLRFLLDEFLTKKKQKLQEIETSLPTVIKQLTKTASKESVMPQSETRLYKGKAGVKKIYNDVLKAKEQRSFVDSTKTPEFFPENFQLFVNAFSHNPEMKMYEMFQSTPKTNEYVKQMKKQENYFYKLLPEEMTIVGQDILIYDNKVAIIYFDDVVHGVVLQNKDLYHGFRLLFDFMWKMLPKNHEDEHE